MNPNVQIVDRGRGPQLSTSRVTVQDLVPYFQHNCSYEEIMAAMPALTVDDIQAVERYVQEHYQEVMEEDRQIRERNAARITPPEIEEIRLRGRAKLLALREEFANKKKQERNGDLSNG
jgi:uncharacterized protein (DUF433 family)